VYLNRRSSASHRRQLSTRGSQNRQSRQKAAAATNQDQSAWPTTSFAAASCQAQTFAAENLFKQCQLPAPRRMFSGTNPLTQPAKEISKAYRAAHSTVHPSTGLSHRAAFILVLYSCTPLFHEPQNSCIASRPVILWRYVFCCYYRPVLPSTRFFFSFYRLPELFRQIGLSSRTSTARARR